MGAAVNQETIAEAIGVIKDQFDINNFSDKEVMEEIGEDLFDALKRKGMIRRKSEGRYCFIEHPEENQDDDDESEYEE